MSARNVEKGTVMSRNATIAGCVSIVAAVTGTFVSGPIGLVLLAVGVTSLLVVLRRTAGALAADIAARQFTAAIYALTAGVSISFAVAPTTFAFVGAVVAFLAGLAVAVAGFYGFDAALRALAPATPARAPRTREQAARNRLSA